jgi:hypothetical protein
MNRKVQDIHKAISVASVTEGGEENAVKRHYEAGCDLGFS